MRGEQLRPKCMLYTYFQHGGKGIILGASVRAGKSWQISDRRCPCNLSRRMRNSCAACSPAAQAAAAATCPMQTLSSRAGGCSSAGLTQSSTVLASAPTARQWKRSRSAALPHCLPAASPCWTWHHQWAALLPAGGQQPVQPGRQAAPVGTWQSEVRLAEQHPGQRCRQAQEAMGVRLEQGH